MWQLWLLYFEGDSWCRWERQGGYVRWFWKPGETLAGWESLAVYNTGLYMTFLNKIVREGKGDRNSETQCCYRVSDCLASEQLRLRGCLFYLPVNAQTIKNRSRGVSFICQKRPGIIRAFACQCLQDSFPSSSWTDTLACQLALSTRTDHTSSPARWVGIWAPFTLVFVQQHCLWDSHSWV